MVWFGLYDTGGEFIQLVISKKGTFIKEEPQSQIPVLAMERKVFYILGPFARGFFKQLLYYQKAIVIYNFGIKRLLRASPSGFHEILTVLNDPLTRETLNEMAGWK